jgi:SHS2 domain-containing protein
VSRHKKAKPATFEILTTAPQARVRVQASTWRHMLEGSARALAHLLLGEAATQKPRSPEMFSIELQRIDFDAMLEAWLNEILYLGRKHAMVFHSFTILQLDLESECRLTAAIEGSPATPAQTNAIDSVGNPSARVRHTGDRLQCEIHFRSAAV